MVVADEDVECAGYEVAKFMEYDCLKPDQRLGILKSRGVHTILYGILPMG